MNKCTTTGEEILKFLKKAKGKTANIRDIAKKLKLDQVTILEKMSQLAQEGKVRNLGFGLFTCELPPQKNLIETNSTFDKVVPNGTEKTFDKVVPKQLNLIESKKDVNSQHPPDAINVYKTGNSVAKYYRYSYYSDKKIKHLHIKGGNIQNPLAKERAKMIRDLIAINHPREQIIKIIKSW